MAVLDVRTFEDAAVRREHSLHRAYLWRMMLLLAQKWINFALLAICIVHCLLVVFWRKVSYSQMKVHAVPGPFIHDEFRDADGNQRLGCLPVCYKVRDRSARFYVPYRSFDFEVICERMLWRSLDNQSFVSTSVGDNESMNEPVAATWKAVQKLKTLSFQLDLASQPVLAILWPNQILKYCCFDTRTQEYSWRGRTRMHGEFGSSNNCSLGEMRLLGLCGNCWKVICKEHFNFRKELQTRISLAALKNDKVAGVKLTYLYCR